MAEQELEVKFYIHDLKAIERKLKQSSASLVQARIFELNLRFDTGDGELTRSGKVLRLRQDVNAVLTYKGPSQARQDVSVRQEIEFNVSDFAAARHFLEALGYQVSVIYEKYRTTYEMGEVEIVLDEMPFGNFAEIEGPDPSSIQETAAKLGVNWDARSTMSYTWLFKRLQQSRNLAFRDLTFANFKAITITPEELGVQTAD